MYYATAPQQANYINSAYIQQGDNYTQVGTVNARMEMLPPRQTEEEKEKGFTFAPLLKVYATGAIAAGEEILVDYGSDFWPKTHFGKNAPP